MKRNNILPIHRISLYLVDASGQRKKPIILASMVTAEEEALAVLGQLCDEPDAWYIGIHCNIPNSNDVEDPVLIAARLKAWRLYISAVGKKLVNGYSPDNLQLRMLKPLEKDPSGSRHTLFILNTSHMPETTRSALSEKSPLYKIVSDTAAALYLRS